MTKKRSNWLVWIGREGEFYPGWPASDHEEPDDRLYQEKLTSGLYRSEGGHEQREREEREAALKAEVEAKQAQAAQAAAEEAQRAAEEAQAKRESLKAEAEAAAARARKLLEVGDAED